LKNVNEPFKQALAKLGWESGRTIDIVERFAERRVATFDGSPFAVAGEIDTEFAPLALRVNLPTVLGGTAYDYKQNPSREERHGGATSPSSFRRTPIVHHCPW
jgi:hypothetical protein